jgi:endonuclease I
MHQNWAVFLIVLTVGILLYLQDTSSLSKTSPSSYYRSLNVADKSTFQKQLTDLISQHRVLQYNDIWDAFQSTDSNNIPNCYHGIRGIGDMYTGICFTYGNQRRGGEQCSRNPPRNQGDCYNREHSWPKSWWGGRSNPAMTDLHHIFPTDGITNRKRSNYPYGDVGEVYWKSKNGSKVGKCKYGPGKCFEPIDEYKGDVARMYFYMTVRYANAFHCCDRPGVNRSRIKPWMKQTLLKWHKMDPVSPKEMKRNDAVHQIQGNRNPFIDHPEWTIHLH